MIAALVVVKGVTVFCIESFGIYSHHFLGVNSPNKTNVFIEDDE